MGIFDLFRIKKASSDFQAIAQNASGKEVLVDSDGNVYSTVKIGKQIWTAENLRTTKFNDNARIPFITNKKKWTNRTSPAYCFYDNDSLNGKKYGALYNWHVLQTGKLAPKGWHVPSLAEWIELRRFLNDNGYNWNGESHGNWNAKAIAAKTDWNYSSDKGAIGYDAKTNNKSGFSALPGGMCSYISENYDFFFCEGLNANFWCRTPYDASKANFIRLYCDRQTIDFDYCDKESGMSVRLIKDDV